MKKILAIILILALLFTFTTCTNKEKPIDVKVQGGVEAPKINQNGGEVDAGDIIEAPSATTGGSS